MSLCPDVLSLSFAFVYLVFRRSLHIHFSVIFCSFFLFACSSNHVHCVCLFRAVSDVKLLVMPHGCAFCFRFCSLFLSDLFRRSFFRFSFATHSIFVFFFYLKFCFDSNTFFFLLFVPPRRFASAPSPAAGSYLIHLCRLSSSSVRIVVPCFFFFFVLSHLNH